MNFEVSGTWHMKVHDEVLGTDLFSTCLLPLPSTLVAISELCGFQVNPPTPVGDGSFVVISTIFTTSSPGVVSVSRNHFHCSSLRSNSSSVKALSWDCRNSATSSGSISNSSSLAISTTSAVTSSIEVLNPQSHSLGLESTSSKLLLMLIFWPLSMNHKCS